MGLDLNPHQAFRWRLYRSLFVVFLPSYGKPREGMDSPREGMDLDDATRSYGYPNVVGYYGEKSRKRTTSDNLRARKRRTLLELAA